ncbi:MAG: hypothetical protein DMG06_07110 [Acidobacteria bacterium]|nr:MAG: hypothetical protein DMG06_07110 [Acidobacteriota bacterium]
MTLTYSCLIGTFSRVQDPGIVILLWKAWQGSPLPTANNDFNLLLQHMIKLGSIRMRIEN